MNSFSNAMVGTLGVWIIVIIIVLVIALIATIILLFKKEKSLELVKFSVSATGVKLEYEIDRDKKIELLVLENIALREQIKTLEAVNKEKTRQFIGLAIVMIAFMVISRLSLKFKGEKATLQKGE